MRLLKRLKDNVIVRDSYVSKTSVIVYALLKYSRKTEWNRAGEEHDALQYQNCHNILVASGNPP